MPTTSTSFLASFSFRKPFFRAVGGMALVFFGSHRVEAASAPTSAYVYYGNRLWRVPMEGQTLAYPMIFGPTEEVNKVGSTAPRMSPDGRVIAFTKNNDLWFLDPKRNATFRATRFGRPSGDEYKGIYVLITDWSADSRKLLFYVSPLEIFDTEHDIIERNDFPMKYGFYVFDMDKGRYTPLDVTGGFEAWLPNGDFVMTSEETELFDQQLLRHRPGQPPALISSYKGWWGQSDLSADGKKLLITFGRPASAPPSSGEEIPLESKILQIDLTNNTVGAVSPTGSWAEYQQPSYSPSGKRVAYLQQSEPDPSGFIKGHLVVDGKPIASFEGIPFDYTWINDRTIVLIGEDVFTLINATSGQELKKISIPATTKGPS